jgi:hypothetical protein
MFEALELPLRNNRVFCKVKKEERQNPKFGPKMGEIEPKKKKTCKKVH